MLEHLIAEFRVLKAILDRVAAEAAAQGTGWDPMACKDLAGDTVDARLANLQSQKNRAAALEVQIAEAQKQIEETQKASQQANGTDAPEGDKALAKAIEPPGGLVYARAKSWAFDNPLVDMAKGLFDSEDFRDYAKGAASTFRAAYTDFEAIKAIWGNVISAGQPNAAIEHPLSIVQRCYLMPLTGDVYRRRIIQSTAATGRNRGSDTAVARAGEVDPEDFPTVNLMAIAGVDVSSASEAALMAGTAEKLLMTVQNLLQTQMFTGLKATAGEVSSVIEQAGGRTAVSAANTNILDDDTEGLEALATGLIVAGAMPTEAVCLAADSIKILNSLRNKRSLVYNHMRPFGDVLGAEVVPSAQLPANTAVLGSFGNPMFHILALKGGFQIASDNSVYFDSGQVGVRAMIDVANVVEQPAAFHVITATNNYRIDA